MSKNVANNVANEKVQDNVKKSHNMTENEQKSEKTVQDVQKNCLSLTEQWKNGELDKCKDYYVKLGGKIITSEYLDSDNDFICYGRPLTNIEVLAPVPSYDLFVELTEKDKENAKLKELLKECKKAIEEVQKNYSYDDSAIEILEPLTTKIDEVLK